MVISQWDAVVAKPTADSQIAIESGETCGVVTLRAARILEQQLGASISACLLPTQAFRWEEPSQSFKESAVLRCEDPRYTPRFQTQAYPPQGPEVLMLLSMSQTPNSRIVGYVLQQHQQGGSVREGHYIAAAAPDFAQVGYEDFEDAQAAVAWKIRQLGIQ